RYFNASPANFGVNRNERPGTFLPFFTLFNNGPTPNLVAGTPVIRTGTSGGQTLSVAMTPLMAAPAASPAPAQTASTTTAPTTSADSAGATTQSAQTAPVTTPAAGSASAPVTTPASVTTPAPSAPSTAPAPTNTAQAILEELIQLANAKNGPTQSSSS